MRPLYIFDLDGTLALTEHRQHLVQCEKPDWRAFFAACVNDKPNMPAITTLMILLRAGADIEVWSGRSDEVREQTEAWLGQFGLGVLSAPVRMRATGDFTPDDQLKKQWLDAMPIDDRLRLVAVFDDRDKVVAMWRASGVPCFQVAPGAF